MNAYAVSLSKYVNTGILALFTLLSYIGLPMHPGRMRRALEIFQRILLAAFLVNANMTIAWLAEGSSAYRLPTGAYDIIYAIDQTGDVRVCGLIEALNPMG
jgi:hypothetical protein